MVTAGVIWVPLVCSLRARLVLWVMGTLRTVLWSSRPQESPDSSRLSVHFKRGWDLVMCGAGLNLCIERGEEEPESSSVMPSGGHEATAVYWASASGLMQAP